MEFSIPYTILEVPNSDGIIAFAINYSKKFLACLTEKSIQLYDNSSFYPILITSLAQFFESFNIKGPNNWIKWITDEDLAFVKQDGTVYIAHLVISERKEPIHDYDNDFYKKYLNRYEFIKIMAPIQISIFNQSETHPYVTSVYIAYEHLCICTSESRVIYISKDGQITHSTQFFNKPNCILNASYFPPESLFCTYNSRPYFISYDLQSFENKKKPVIDQVPIKHPTLTAINYQQTYLAVFKAKKGTLRIYQLGLPEWKPPITVYAPPDYDYTQLPADSIEANKISKENNDAINDPVIHIFWSSNGTSLIIIHKSGKTAYFFIESKTLHKSKINYFSQQLLAKENPKEDLNPSEPSEKDVLNLNECPYKFLFDLYGERLFVTNGKSLVFITLARNKNFFLYTPTWIFDLRQSVNIYNGTSLYPIRDVSLDFNNEFILVSNDKGIQLIDSKSSKIVSDFIPVVSESNKKHRCLLNAHFIGDSICVVVSPSNKLSNDTFNLNFCDNIGDKSELFDCDNSFYQQFDSVYKYDDINKKEKASTDEKPVSLIDDGDEIKSLILLLSVNRKNAAEKSDENDKDVKFEIKPDLLIKSYFVPKFFDYFEDHGIIADEKNIAYINTLTKLTHPSKKVNYFSSKSGLIFAVSTHVIKEDFKIKQIAMSSTYKARLLLSDNLIHDEKLQAYGSEMFITQDKTPIYFDCVLSTKTPPVVFYIYDSRIIENKSYKSAFYNAMLIFSCFDNFLRALEVPFGFDGMIFYVLPENIEFGKFKFKFLNIGQHILIEALKDYQLTTYLINFVYRRFNQIPIIICETLKEELRQDFLPQFIMIIFPHLELEEISQIIQILPTRTDKKTFSNIFNAIFNYISYSNKYYTSENKKYLEIIIRSRPFCSKIMKLEWNKIFSLIDKNIRNHIFLNISQFSYIGLISEMNAEPSNTESIFDDGLIQFLLEKGEIIRAYSISNKEDSNYFVDLFKKSLSATKSKEFQENFYDALNQLEKEKIQWSSNNQIYPIVFHFLGCLFQVEGLSLFSAATFIIIGQSQKFQAVIISDERAKSEVEKYLNENPGGLYVKEIRESIEQVVDK